MMPQFANPGYLWLTLLVPVLGWWSLRRRRSAMRHPAVGELASLPLGRSRLARWGPVILRSLALLLLILALACPRWPDLHTRIETEGVAIVMLVDVSGSMAERDFDWGGEPITRLEAVKRAFHLFVAGDEDNDASKFQGRPTDPIGLVTFATRPETACPLTLSHSVLLRLLDAEQPRRIPGESETNIIDAVALGLHRLRSAATRRKVLVLLSDGDHNVPHPQSGWISPREAAQVAKGLSIPIYTIDAGSLGASANEAPAKEGPSSSPGENRVQAVRTLEELAHITHGHYFQAHDTQGLLSACQAIDALERSDVQSFRYRRYHEAYPWFGLSAFILFSLALGLERTVWRRVP